MVENKRDGVPALVELHSSRKSVRSFRKQSVGKISWPLHWVGATRSAWGESFVYRGWSFVHSLSHVWLFATLWTAAHQASLSVTISWSLVKLMSIESVMPSNHLILCRPLLLLPSVFPSIRVFFQWVGSLHQVTQSIGASASASVFIIMNIQDWFPLGLTGLISLQTKGRSRVL